MQPEVRTTTEIKEGRTFFRHWWEHEKPPFALLLGDFGMGKTFLCRMFTQELIEARQHDPDLPVPVYIDLRLVNFVRHRESQQLTIPSLKQEIRPFVSGIPSQDSYAKRPGTCPKANGQQ